MNVLKDQTISNLWQDENATPCRGPVVVLDITETETDRFEFGAALIDNTWYRVVRTGGGENWQASWSELQQAFRTIDNELTLDQLDQAMSFA